MGFSEDQRNRDPVAVLKASRLLFIGAWVTMVLAEGQRAWLVAARAARTASLNTYGLDDWWQLRWLAMWMAGTGVVVWMVDWWRSRVRAPMPAREPVEERVPRREPFLG